MKINKNIATCISSVAFMGTISLCAQSVDSFVAQGRSKLVEGDIASAYQSFSEAVKLAPDHSEANLLVAMSRLLAYPMSEEGAAFLKKYGIDPDSLSIYHFDPVFPKDMEGNILIPEGTQSNELWDQLEDSVLPVIRESLSNLNQISDTSFTTQLSSLETGTSSTSIDYADISLMRAFCCAGEFVILLQSRYDLDCSANSVYQQLQDEALTAESFLNEYTHVLEFADQENVPAAEAAFANAVKYYLDFYNYASKRSFDAACLFSIAKPEQEQKFRHTLEDVQSSLQAPTVLREYESSEGEALTASMHSFLYGQQSLRDILPDIRGNSIIRGTFPDTTFGGGLIGITQNDFDSLGVKEFDYTIQNGEVVLSGFNPKGVKTLEIPATIEGYPVKKIVCKAEESWSGYINYISGFNDESIETIVIPDSVTEIGEYAFGGCYKLSSLYFKGNAPTVGTTAFSICPAIAYYIEGTTGWSNPWNGLSTAIWVPEPEVPTIEVSAPVVTEVGNVTFKLIYQGTLQYSTDMMNWQDVKGASGGTYSVDTSLNTSRFYRVKK